MVEIIADGKVRTTTFDYDDKGNLTSICNANTDCSHMEYERHGLPTDIYDFANTHTVNAYNAAGDLISSTNAENETTDYAYDRAGRLASTTLPEEQQNIFAYDGNDNLLSVNGPMGYQVRYIYDLNNQLLEEYDPNGGKIEYAYDASGNLLGVANQLGFYAERYQYGKMNEVVLFGDAEGRKWTYEHDVLQQVTDAFGPMDVHLTYEYDAVGNVIQSTDAEGRITQTEYDGLNRPVTTV